MVERGSNLTRLEVLTLQTFGMRLKSFEESKGLRGGVLRPRVFQERDKKMTLLRKDSLFMECQVQSTFSPVSYLSFTVLTFV